ncbi:MAG: SpoIID/LytB domain-containing protein [Armatimonadota bacterium]|nr:SpoIID/LytB domain-containing protein [Armatimonadota bacterium]
MLHCLLYLLLAPLLEAQEPFRPEVRVWLTRWRNLPLVVTSASPWQATGAEKTHRLPAGETVTVEREGDDLALRFGGKRVTAQEWTLQGEAPLTLSQNAGSNSQQSYRGRLVLRLRQGKLQVVNVLPLEEYLLGVVPLEMPPRFPAEALKAQAIAARSWSVRNRGKHEAEGTDFCDGTHCQVYRGMLAEQESTTQAVRETAGLILVNAEAPVDGVYTADCGGQPLSPDGANAPASDRDEQGEDYCAANPRHCWVLRFPILEVWQLAGGKDSPQEAPKGDVEAQVVQTDSSGRVRVLRLRWGNQTADIAATQLRQRLLLPSTLCSVRVEADGTLVFEGRGSGHGGGLCQWGAAGRARVGQKAEQILQFYYPSAQLAPLSEAMWRWREDRKGKSAR